MDAPCSVVPLPTPCIARPTAPRDAKQFHLYPDEPLGSFKDVSKSGKMNRDTTRVVRFPAAPKLTLTMAYIGASRRGCPAVVDIGEETKDFNDRGFVKGKKEEKNFCSIISTDTNSLTRYVRLLILEFPPFMYLPLRLPFRLRWTMSRPGILNRQSVCLWGSKVFRKSKVEEMRCDGTKTRESVSLSLLLQATCL